MRTYHSHGCYSERGDRSQTIVQGTGKWRAEFHLCAYACIHTLALHTYNTVCHFDLQIQNPPDILPLKKLQTENTALKAKIVALQTENSAMKLKMVAFEVESRTPPSQQVGSCSKFLENIIVLFYIHSYPHLPPPFCISLVCFCARKKLMGKHP